MLFSGVVRCCCLLFNVCRSLVYVFVIVFKRLLFVRVFVFVVCCCWCVLLCVVVGLSLCVVGCLLRAIHFVIIWLCDVIASLRLWLLLDVYYCACLCLWLVVVLCAVIVI